MRNLLVILLLGFSTIASGQNIFQKIQAEMASFRPDTTELPDDKITRKIRELRVLRGPFNLNEAMEFKVRESLEKKEIDSATAQKMLAWYSTGRGHVLIERAIGHLYRDSFTYPELKKLVKFYNSPAGQKLASEMPLIMVKSVMAAELAKPQG